MASTDKQDAVAVVESFIGNINGEDRTFRAGELVRPDDPAIKKWPKMFGPARYAHDSPVVEQATAAPGERR